MQRQTILRQTAGGQKTDSLNSDMEGCGSRDPGAAIASNSSQLRSAGQAWTDGGREAQVLQQSRPKCLEF